MCVSVCVRVLCSVRVQICVRVQVCVLLCVCAGVCVLLWVSGVDVWWYAGCLVVCVLRGYVLQKVDLPLLPVISGTCPH